MKKAAVLLALGFGLLSSAPAANALLGIAGDTNAFIFRNATTNGGHAQGSIVVGGNWGGTSYEARQQSTSAAPALGTNTSVYIGGNDSITGDKGSNFIRAMSGNVVIKGTYSAQNVDAQNGGTVSAGSYDLAPTIANLQKLSSDIALLSGTAITINDPNNVKVDLSAIAGNVKVLNIAASALTGNSTLDFLNSTSSDTVIINVTGTGSVNWGWSTNFDATRILWNFADTTSLAVGSRSFTGTILAPKADVTQSQNIDGTLIAKSWTNNNSVELHNFAFNGNIPLVSAPEPAGMMVTGGFLGLALFSRRRQQVRL
ncbi:MAG: hypothetical protein JWM59_4642 [Verrucomicrobiales bacterium]|nr:hypothetical protein [Verrucomicrobiales bacterium]